MSPETLSVALAAHRLETARRIGFTLLAAPATRTPAAILGTHDALAALAELHEAAELLERYADLLREEPFAVALRLAEDTHHLARESHYRISAEAKAGLTVDEYLDKYRNAATGRFAAALREAKTPAQLDMLRAACRRLRRPLPPELADAAVVGPPASPADDPAPAGKLRGSLAFPDGSPVAHAIVTLGLAVKVDHPDPRTYISGAPDYLPAVGPLAKLTATTGASGAFHFESVPAGRHEFLAVTLDPDRHAIPTRFVARDITVKSSRETDLDRLSVDEWRSAAPASWTSPHVGARKLADHRLHNPFYYDFRRQLLRLPLPEAVASSSGGPQLRVEIEPGRPEAHQIIGREVVLMAELPMRSTRGVALYAADSPSAVPATRLRLIEESEALWQLDTGVAQFRIPGPAASVDIAPILAVRGADQRWRGRGRFVLPAGVAITRHSTELLQRGPILIEVRLDYALSDGTRYVVRLTAVEGEPVLEVHEASPALEGAAFEFSLAEFSGGRTFRHWTRESPEGGRHWYPLEAKDALIAALPESVPWWVPPQFFAAAFTPDGLAERDYIAFMSLRRGAWIDREFARITQGPIDADGAPNHELDWPYPEMLGSTISQLTAHTTRDGDVFVRCGFFDGERRWGLYASSLEANDGPWKDMSAVQHAHSSPRLQDFKDWTFDAADVHARPHVVAKREDLVSLRAKTRNPRFSRLWQKIRDGGVRGPGKGLAFAIGGDPLSAWRKRIDLVCVAEIRSRMTLLGRDWSDMYSPVLGRPITEWVEEYDLIAASGVFSPEEERSVRAFFILMGHMFMEPDFMNWQFGGRNANFESDRADIVGAIGIVFDGHPDADKFQRHVIELTRRAFLAYCTPGSGKWHENPACYYLQNAKCRMNLVYHLVAHGRLALDEIPLLKDFLRWGILLLTPPHPVAYAAMRDGTGAELFDRVEKVRKIAPIGDHATIGRWLPEHYATIGKLFRATDPAFAAELLNAYFVANADGVRLATRHAKPVEQEGEQLFHDIYASATFGNLPLFFTVIDEDDIPAAPEIRLASRRLEGFGAVLRHGFNTDREGYVLLKQGPGGYRYHRSEGGLIFFADGKPLVFDGGEAGETWRHSTLSFHDVHMPLMPGRLERIFATPSFQFTQGIHAGIVAPGEPTFLCDNASHFLIAECYRRWNAPRPGVVRSLAWLGGRTLIVHDAIDLPENIPSHWHLQVVGGAPAGDPENGYVFPGRFGTDLQVLFPGQSFAAAKVRHLPIHEYRGAPADWFAMQHLQVSMPGARHYLAVLHPVDKDGPVSAEALRDGDRVVGARIRTAAGDDSRVWFGRDPVATRDADHLFAGRSGALLLAGGDTSLCVVGAGRLEHGGWLLESDGPEALLTLGETGATLTAQGSGEVRITREESARIVNVDERIEFTLPYN